MTTTGDGSKIVKRFFIDLDEFLKEKYQTLKCSHISDIYFQCFDYLKKFKGNSSGFTGLSELLIFRFLFHLCGGALKPVPCTRHLPMFVSDLDERLGIGLGLPVKANGNEIRPDIVIYRNGQPRAICQVKVYPTGWSKEVDREVQTFKDLKKKYPGLRALLIIFNELPKRGKLLSLIKKHSKENADWLNFLFLKGNDELLGDKLKACLSI